MTGEFVVDDDRQDADKQGGTLVLRPAGRLDRDTCGELRHQLGAAFAAGVQSIAVDLREVTAADVDGLRVLGGAAKHMSSRGGLLAVTRANPAITRMMRVNGMGEMLDLASSLPARSQAEVAEQTADRAARRAERKGTLTVVLPADDDQLAVPGTAVPG